ncbi:unnamed protein product [Lactuca virosa]|uniref:Transcriptional factor DELLA N-terminal domain-containing protein n=1 Tax=Lactuca virosa TaxID=75947 RepID=A0AAU9MG46_9ASTR|nr:unnamed protein product [Lactuca virosa]
MERDYLQQDYTFYNGGSSTSASTAAASASVFSDVIGKSKLWDEVKEQDANIDELLVVLDFKVKSCDVADIAQKIEHLEGVLGNDDGLSQLASDSVHYNHSDLKSIICELNPTNQPPVIDDLFVNKTASVTLSAVDSSFLFVDNLQRILGNTIERE